MLHFNQGDQKIGKKFRPNFGKSSQNSCQVKTVKIATSKLNLKVLYNKPLEQLKYPQQAMV
jgi:hypothetical protein